MTKNITLRLDEALLTRLKHRAVDHHQSVSAWVASVLRETVAAEDEYDTARKRAVKRLEKGLKLGGKPLRREAIYER